MGLTCADIEAKNLFAKHRMPIRAPVGSSAVFVFGDEALFGAGMAVFTNN